MQAARCLFGSTGFALLALLAGCGGGGRAVNPADQACVDLDGNVASTARQLSQAGVTRGNIESFELPRLLSRSGEKAKQALADRQTRRIDKLTAEQQSNIAERRATCVPQGR